MNITECDGYKKLMIDINRDLEKPTGHDPMVKLDWILKRVQHYADKLNLDPCDILNSWEKQRNYWYMNYYQECEQPEIKSDRVRVFENLEELKEAIGKDGFRCPMCGGVSKSPYECDSGLDMSPGKKCDWKSWGLFRDLGKGMYIYVKSELRGQIIFMPLAWENNNDTQA